MSYKFSKFFVPIQHPWNGPFWGSSGSLLPQILPGFAKIFTTGSIQRNKNNASRIFENFLQEQEIRGVCTFGQTFASFFPLKKIAEIRKKKEFWRKKFSHWAFQKLQNQDVSLVPFKWKIGLLFARFERFLVNIWVRSKVKRSEWNSNLGYTGAISSEVLNMQRFSFHNFPIWRFLITNVFFSF